MARTIDEVVALHIGGLSIELCKMVKATEDLREELDKLKRKAPKVDTPPNDEKPL